MSRSLPLFLVVLLSVSILACGWFTEDDLDITYTEKFSFDIPLDADKLCPSGEDCTTTTIPTPMDRELTPIDFTQDLDLIEATGKPELAEYTNRFKSVTISKIEYANTKNTLTFDVPPIKLYMGPLGSEQSDSTGVLEMATLPEVKAGTTGKWEATFNEANKDGVSTLIKSLQSAAVAKATPIVKMGQPFPPSGATKLTVTVYVTFVANPADAIRK